MSFLVVILGIFCFFAALFSLIVSKVCRSTIAYRLSNGFSRFCLSPSGSNQGNLSSPGHGLTFSTDRLCSHLQDWFAGFNVFLKIISFANTGLCDRPLMFEQRLR